MTPPEPGGEARLELAAATGLSLVLAALHVFALLHAGPLWRDEISSLSLATSPSWHVFWDRLLFDPFPVLFFVLLRMWHAVAGDADFALRMLGTAIGCAGVVAFWVAARMTGRTTPLVALAMLGASPVLITWGDSLRAYGTGIVWIVLAFGCFWRLLRDASPGSFLLAAGASILAVQSVFTNALLVFACAGSAILVAAWSGAWRTAAAALGAGALAAISLFPYVPRLLATQEWQAIRTTNAGLLHYLGVIGDSLMGWGRFSLWLWIVVAPLAVVAGLAYSRRKERPPVERALAAYSSIAVLLGFAATLVFFRFVSWPTNKWYYLPLLALVASAINTLAAVLAASCGARRAKIGAAVLAVAIASPWIHAALRVRASNLDLVARTIETAEQPGDLVVLEPFTTAISFARHYRGTSEWSAVPPLEDVSLHRWDLVLARMRESDALAPLREKIRATLGGGHRVWLVTTTGWHREPKKPLSPAPLDPQHPRRLGYYLFPWGRQILYELQAGGSEATAVAVESADPVSAYERAQVHLVTGARASPSRD